MLSDEETIRGTLEWCNSERAEQGKVPLPELPKGRKGDHKSCPCGAATDLYVGLKTYGASYADIAVLSSSNKELPPVVKQFVRKFDDGRYPQFDMDLDEDND